MENAHRRIESTLEKLIRDAAEDWGISPANMMCIFAVPFVVPLITIITALVSRPLFDALTAEDHFGEWLQVLGWSAALYFVCVVFVRLLRSRRHALAVLYACFGLGIVFIIGEEISWGQRIFAFGTPEGLAVVNRQGEVNVHNIFGVQTAFSWGLFLVGLYGSLLPYLAARKWGSYAGWPDFVRALVPHWIMIPYFLLLFVWRFYRNLFQPVQEYYFAISRFGETTELVLAAAVLAFAWHQWSRNVPAR